MSAMGARDGPRPFVLGLAEERQSGFSAELMRGVEASAAELGWGHVRVNDVHIGPQPPDPALERLGYTEIARERIERAGTHHRDIRATFPYHVSEHGSRLFRGPPLEPVAAVRFHDVAGEGASPGWPDHAAVPAGGRYVVALALAAHGPRDVPLEYLSGPGRITIMRVEGAEVVRLAETDVDRWMTTTIPLPEASATTVTIELEAAGSRISAFSGAALVERAPGGAP